MNRLHVHLHVNDIAQSVKFYSTLFGREPARREMDYAKWMLDDPRVNFAISTGGEIGLSHLGIQVDDNAALAEATARAVRAAGTVVEERSANCCYAVGDKAWAVDPQGVRWETFHTVGDLTTYGAGAEKTVVREATTSACCAPNVGSTVESAACCAGTAHEP